MYPFVPQTQSQVIISSAVLPHRSLFPLIRLSWNKSKTLIGALFTKVFSHLYNHSVSMFVNLCLKSFQKYSNVWVSYFFLFLKNFYFYFILLYNTVLVLPYIDMNAFELWCWRRLLRIPWTARRSNQSIPKEISPGISFFVLFFLEEMGKVEFYLILFLKNFYFYFILLYNTVLVLPYIDMNPPRVYMWSQTWTPPPTSHPISSLWIIPMRQPQASCILYWT